MAANNTIANDHLDFHIGNNGNVENAAQTNTNQQPLEPASAIVMRMPELARIIVPMLDPFSLAECHALNNMWRETVGDHLRTYREVRIAERARFIARPLQVNIHILNTIILQYPPDEGPQTHSRQRKVQFVFSCQTGGQSQSVDSFGGSERSNSSGDCGHIHPHRHHNHFLAHQFGDNLPHEYQSSAFVSNVYFKTARRDSTGSSSDSSSSTLPSSFSPSLGSSHSSRPRQQHQQLRSPVPRPSRGSTIDQVLQSQSATLTRPYDADMSAASSGPSVMRSELSLSPDQVETSSFSQYNARGSGSAPNQVDTVLVPCPYEVGSDSSLSNEDTPPSVRKSLKSGAGNETVHGMPESSRTALYDYGEYRPEPPRHREDSAAEDLDETGIQAMELNDDMEWSGQSSGATASFAEIQASPFSTRMPSEASILFQLQQEQEQQRQYSGKQSARKHSSSSGKKRSRPSRNWSMVFQTYLHQKAAINAMIRTCREYMEAREEENCTVIESSALTRIIWNDSTKQELIYTITPSPMDRSNPDYIEHDYDPAWRHSSDETLRDAYHESPQE